MPVLKVRCPECDAALRQPIDAVDRPTDFTISCPKCGHEFVAEAQADARPRKSAKGTRRRDEDDEPVGRSRTGLIVAGVVAGVLVIGGAVAAVVAFSGKDKDTAKADPPAKVDTKPEIKPDPKPVTKPDPKPRPDPEPIESGPNPTPSPTPTPKPKEPDDDDDEPAIKLPPPPVIRITGSAVPLAAPVGKPPATPPLSPDEDPFVRAAAFRPDGPLPKLPVLPPVAQRPVLVLDAKGHSSLVRTALLTPDAKKVVTVAEDKSVRVWDATTGEVLHTVRLPGVPGPGGTPYAGALAPNGKQLAVGGWPLGDGKAGIPVYLIAAETGRLERVIFGVRETVLALDFSATGNRIAVGCADGTVQTFDSNTGQPAGQVKLHTGSVRHVRFQPKGGRLASSGADKTVRIWEPASPAKAVTLQLAAFGPNGIAWSPDGQTLAIGGTVAGDILIVGADGKEQKVIPGFKDPGGLVVQVMRLAFTPDGKELVWGGIGRTGHAGVIDIANGRRRLAFPHHTNTVGSAEVSRDGTLAATVGGDNSEVFLWRVADGTVTRKFVGDGKAVFGVRWAADGKSIAFGNVNTLDRDFTHGVQHTFRLDDFGIGGPPEADKYIKARTAAAGLQIRVRNRQEFDVLAGDQLVKAFKLGDGQLLDALSIVPGTGILMGSTNGLELLDPASGKLLRKFVGHTGAVLGIAPSPDDRYFVTGSLDQTIRLWAIDREEPLLSLFVVGREWIAWTPEGYYACSAYGEQLIAWQVNNGTAKLPTVSPAARFRPSMYQPAMLKYVIPAGNLPVAMAMAQKFDKSLVKVTSVADVLPPEVVLVSPAGEDAKIDRDAITVKASAKGNDKHPVAAMRLLVDGRPFRGANGVKHFEKPQASAEAEWEVPLDPGAHSFAVIAESDVSKGMSRPAFVTRPGEPPKPNLYVLAVGVSAYPGDMKLRYAASDARLLTKTLREKSKGVFREIDVRVLTDADATKKGIQDGLDWLKSKMTAKDVGIVLFSGHGARDPRSGRFYLVPVDVSEENPAGTCLSGDEFKAALENMPGRLVAILDACHSGAVAEKPRPPARADGLVRDLVADDAGVVVMCASLGREYAIESRASKAGFFTLGLVEGLSGHADLDQDGTVYIHELDLYASIRVNQLSGGRQNPTTGRPPSIRPFPIAVAEKATRP